MYKFIIAHVFALAALTSTAQQKNYSADEATRLKCAVKYVEAASFSYESLTGDAMFHVMLDAFSTGLVVPEIDLGKVTSASDAAKLSALKLSLQQLLAGPVPTWEQLVQMEKIRLDTEAKTISRSYRYVAE